MENKQIILLLIIILIAACIIGVGAYFLVGHENNINHSEINATNNTNNTNNTTENINNQNNQAQSNSNQGSSGSSKVAEDSSSDSSNSGAYDEDIDLSEKAGYDLHVNVHHNGDGSKSWTDAAGYHTAPDDKELIF